MNQLGPEPPRVPICVAVATVGRPDSLERCLRALESAEALPEEVIVVDQGGDPRTRGVVDAFGAGPLRARLIAQAHRGLSVSRNLAAAHAGCPILAVTDDDCVPSPGWLTAIDRAFCDVRLAAVSGPMLPLGPPEPDRLAVASRTQVTREEFAQPVAPWRVGTGGNMAFRRDWLRRIGGYDERLGAGSPGGAGEDLDVIERLLRAGGRIRYEPTAVVEHERQARVRRRATRTSYGRGVGACCGLWLRAGSTRGLAVLLEWLLLRFRLLGQGVSNRRFEVVGEEWLILSGTARGLAYGLRVGGRK